MTIVPGRTGGPGGGSGAPGASAYEIWLGAGNVGDVNAYLTSLKGAKGDKGDKGDSGTGGTGGSVDLSNYPTLDQVATVEDITLRSRVAETYAASGVVAVGTVQYPARITAAAITSETVTIGTSNTNYWTFELGVWRENESLGATPPFTPISSKSLQVGGEAMVALYAWTFDSAAFDSTLQSGVARNVAAPRDVIGFRLTRVGSPTSLARMSYSIRAEPIR